MKDNHYAILLEMGKLEQKYGAEKFVRGVENYLEIYNYAANIERAAIEERIKEVNEARVLTTEELRHVLFGKSKEEGSQ